MTQLGIFTPDAVIAFFTATGVLLLLFKHGFCSSCESFELTWHEFCLKNISRWPAVLKRNVWCVEGRRMPHRADGSGMSCAPWDGNGPHNQLGLRITAALWVPLQSHPQTEGFSRAGLRSTRLKEKEKKNKLETESRWIYMICLRAVIKLRRPETEKHEWAFRCITSCLFCTDKWVRCFLVIWNWELWLVSIVGLREQLRV